MLGSQPPSPTSGRVRNDSVPSNLEESICIFSPVHRLPACPACPLFSERKQLYSGSIAVEGKFAKGCCAETLSYSAVGVAVGGIFRISARVQPSCCNCFLRVVPRHCRLQRPLTPSRENYVKRADTIGCFKEVAWRRVGDTRNISAVDFLRTFPIRPRVYRQVLSLQ